MPSATTAGSRSNPLSRTLRTEFVIASMKVSAPGLEQEKVTLVAEGKLSPTPLRSKSIS